MRLEGQVAAAQSLLSYAAANGKVVGDATRDALISAADELSVGKLDAAGEASFFKAYEALTKTLAPVTAKHSRPRSAGFRGWTRSLSIPFSG
jgi:hypothetical protein